MSQTYVEELGASKWSIGVHTSDEVLYYQFRVNNDRILDPAGLETTDDIRWDNGKIVLPKCVARKENAEVNITTKPNIPMGRTILQEVNVGAYTNQGYAGLATKTGYLKRKCTTVSAMPIAQGDPGDVSFHNPLTGQLNKEAWFYNTVLFFAPSANFATSRATAVREAKKMVRDLHNAGLEFVVDFVFNHTREGNNQGPTIHFKALGKERYYVVKDGVMWDEHTGCGNEANVFDPMTVEFIIHCLRFWYNVIGIDGVRFDLFSVLLQNPQLAERILTDPQLSGMKIFPEPWAINLYNVGYCGLGTAEWNGKYRDAMRKWLKGDEDMVNDFAGFTAGSVGLFQPAQGHWSVNFITCHDGFDMDGLFKFNNPDTTANGEGCRDGSKENESWNCGPDHTWDGELDPTRPGLSAERIAYINALPLDKRLEVMALRRQQVRNAFAVLFLSQGVPMSLYGDEIGRSQGANNNAYCQPELCRMPWENLENPEFQALEAFVDRLVALRQQVDINECHIVRHGTKPRLPDTSNYARFLATEFVPNNGRRLHLYWAANTYWGDLEVTLPAPPTGTKWYRVIDTAQATVDESVPVSGKIIVQARSNVAFISR